MTSVWGLQDQQSALSCAVSEMTLSSAEAKTKEVLCWSWHVRILCLDKHLPEKRPFATFINLKPELTTDSFVVFFNPLWLKEKRKIDLIVDALATPFSRLMFCEKLIALWLSHVPNLWPSSPDGAVGSSSAMPGNRWLIQVQPAFFFFSYQFINDLSLHWNATILLRFHCDRHVCLLFFSLTVCTKSTKLLLLSWLFSFPFCKCACKSIRIELQVLLTDGHPLPHWHCETTASLNDFIVKNVSDVPTNLLTCLQTGV